jgi:hypothetical protein
VKVHGHNLLNNTKTQKLENSRGSFELSSLQVLLRPGFGRDEG